AKKPATRSDGGNGGSICSCSNPEVVRSPTPQSPLTPFLRVAGFFKYRGVYPRKWRLVTVPVRLQSPWSGIRCGLLSCTVMPNCLKCGAELAVNEEGVAPVLCDRCAGRATSRARRSLKTGTLTDFPATSGLVVVNILFLIGMVATGGVNTFSGP